MDLHSKLDSKGYRLWDSKAKKLNLSRDFTFFEHEFDGRIKTRTELSVSEMCPVELTASDEVTLEEEQLVNGERIHDNTAENADKEVQNEDRQLLHRSERIRKPPERDNTITGNWWEIASTRYSFAESIMEEPTTVEEALSSSEKSEWEKALDNEYSSLMEHKTWDLIKSPEGRNIIDSKWVFKVKTNADSKIKRHKASLIARGFTQTAGVDFEEAFSPVVKYTSIRTLSAIVNQLDLELHQMDVSTAFINGDLQEEIYMKQPEGYVKQGQENLVCKLNKSFYGLKQASRCWYETFDQFLKKPGYKQCTVDSYMYIKRVGENFLYIALYVDDLLLASNNLELLKGEKELLETRFHTKDLGEAYYCLGIQIQRNRDNKEMILHQTKYLSDVLKRLGMENCNAIATPQEQITVLMQNEGNSVNRQEYQTLIGSSTFAATDTLDQTLLKH